MKPDPEDKQFDDYTISEVRDDSEYYSVGCNSLWLSVSKEYGIVPKVGTTMRTYGGMGYPVRGLVLDGVCAFYKTPADHQERMEIEQAKKDNEDHRKWVAAKPEREAKVAVLPPEFQKRIAWFRHSISDFWKHEGYEVFCCEQAVVMANALGTHEKVRTFSKHTSDEQKRLVPDLDEGHSGNTFMAATAMGALYLENPGLLWKWHAAIHGITGCEDGGCYAAHRTKGSAFLRAYQG